MRRVFVGGVVLAACLSLAGAEALVIAERGKESDYAIVMPANPSPSHHYAAVEFRNFIADVTGVFFIEAEGTDRETILRDNGMIMLLPYVRAMISQLVSLANLPTPVILPPLDPSQMQPVEPEQAQ